jgi:hypothetical protein
VEAPLKKSGGYFVYMYKNRTMKPVEIVLRHGGGKIRENDGGVESN